MFWPRRSKARALFSTSKAVSVPSRDIRGARRSSYCVVFSMRQVAHYTPRHFTSVHVGAGAPPAQPGEARQFFVRHESFVAQKKGRVLLANPDETSGLRGFGYYLMPKGSRQSFAETCPA